MHIPVMKRSNGTSIEVGSTARISAFAAAATAADPMKKRRGSNRSASPRLALKRLPATKPACTPLVSNACAKDESGYSASNAGTTADAENHTAIAATWHTAMIVIDAAFELGTTAEPDERYPAGEVTRM